ncbi:MAG TPA: acyltransferase domain-containing protein, partial [Longimicrobiaceae bacterium]|nr:acyltransferase domain-containing protein [Longimicrobiaceae bacterium]
DVCFTAATGRSHFAHRLALVGSDAEELRARLAEHGAGGDPVGLYRGHAPATRPKVAFLFTGQGAQYVGMGRELYESEPVFRDALDRCDEILRGELERPLLSVLYPAEGEDSPLDRTAYTQPALFALEYALVQLWKSRGVEPAFVAGHSVGEYVAACVAGVLGLEDALRLIAARGRLMEALPEGGAMAALFTEEARVRALVEPRSGRVSVAAVNGPTETVISGEAEAVEEIVSLLSAEGVEHRRLVVSHAFHSPLLEPMLEEFERVASAVEYREPTLGILSNVTGRLAKGEELRSADYWRRHTREAVRFADTVQSLWELGVRVFVEVGPSATLLGMGRRIAPEGEGAWAPSLRKGRGERETFASAVASVWTAGVGVDWEAVLGRRRRVELPTYPFQRRPYWMEAPRPRAAVGPRRGGGLLGERIESPGLNGALVWQTELSTDAQPHLADHRIYGAVVVSGAQYLAMAAAAAADVLGGDAVELREVAFHQPIVLEEGETRHVQLVLSPAEGDGRRRFEVYARAGEGEWTLHATGFVAPAAPGEPEQVEGVDAVRARCTGEQEGEAFYRAAEEREVHLGPGFRWSRHFWRRDGEALSAMERPEGAAPSLAVPPGLLDACMQLVGVAVPPDPEGRAAVPTAVGTLRVHRRPAGRLWCRGTARREGRDGLAGEVVLMDGEGVPVAELLG